MFGSVFQFSHLKTAGFRFADFSNLVIGFKFSFKKKTVFQVFFFQSFSSFREEKVI